MATFTLFWLTGKYQIVKGANIASAMNDAGIGNGALRALDFYSRGDVGNKWEWDKKLRTWIEKENISLNKQ